MSAIIKLFKFKNNFDINEERRVFNLVQYPVCSAASMPLDGTIVEY